MTEDARRHFVQGVGQAVDRLELTVTEAVDIVTPATREVPTEAAPGQPGQ